MTSGCAIPQRRRKPVLNISLDSRFPRGIRDRLNKGSSIERNHMVNPRNPVVNNAKNAAIPCVTAIIGIEAPVTPKFIQDRSVLTTTFHRICGD